MSRKNRDNEQSFGSDAFLDVIANIVGILIILIVVAGVKVSRAPLITAPLNVPDVEGPTIELDIPTIVIEAAPMFADLGQSAGWPSAFLPEPVPEVVVEPAPIRPPPPEVRPPAELVDQSQTLNGMIADLEQRISEAQRQYATLDQQHRDAQTAISEHTAMLAAQRGSLAEEASQLDQMQAALLQTESQLSELRYALDVESQREPEVEVLEHRLTPLGRVVTQREVHFRLAEGRISHVPIEELAALVQTDIQRQRDLLLKLRYYKGSVGPEEGFRMEYIVQQQDMSLLDELRAGGTNMIRVGVTQWLLVPEPGLEGETPDVALREGSRFLRILRRYPGATLTFWVYPDSFEAHQTLNTFVREAGFEVAARPLPAGVPIAGSPNGSRSVSQ